VKVLHQPERKPWQKVLELERNHEGHVRLLVLLLLHAQACAHNHAVSGNATANQDDMWVQKIE